MLKVSNNVRQLCPIKSHVNLFKKYIYSLLYLNVNLGVQQLTAHRLLLSDIHQCSVTMATVSRPIKS